jgi:hypothetical protein
MFSVGTVRCCLPYDETPYNVIGYAESTDPFYRDRSHTELYDDRWGNVKVKAHFDDRRNLIYLMTESGRYISRNATPVQYRDTTSVTDAMRVTYGTYSPKAMYSVDGEGNRMSWNTLTDEVPLIETIYEFRNDELLAKLYQVKLWLERYVTGVGCYISDINGENIVLERIKNQAHVTSGEVKDITNIGKFTPHAHIKTHIETDSDGNVKEVDDMFTDSSVCIACSLNEFRSLSFEDYADFPIERFVKWQYDASGNQVPLKLRVHMKNRMSNEEVYVSPPLNALTVADELSYTLRLNNPESGSLYEFADSSCLDNPIMVSD